MRRITIYQVDSFTTQKFKGNPAGVVLNADELSEEEMQKIARELNNSETAFILSADGPDHDVRIRYFTPLMEVPVCGHATIAAHYVRAIENRLENGTIHHKIQVGILPVEIVRENDDYAIVMTQGEIEFREPFDQEIREAILDALGLDEMKVDRRCPMQVVSTGHSKVLIGIRERHTLDSLSPDMHRLKALSKDIGCNGYFVFTLDSKTDDILAHGRMFAPAVGVDEDPVTGNANGPLGAYLVRHGLIGYDSTGHGNASVSFNAEQGSAIGRSGIVTVTVDIADNTPQRVKIKGRAIIVFKTEIEL